MLDLYLLSDSEGWAVVGADSDSSLALSLGTRNLSGKEDLKGQEQDYRSKHPDFSLVCRGFRDKDEQQVIDPIEGNCFPCSWSGLELIELIHSIVSVSYEEIIYFTHIVMENVYLIYDNISDIMIW